jgi:hypothetical protein
MVAARARVARVVWSISLAAACFAGIPSAHAALIVNGSFESPLVPQSSTCGVYNDCLGFNVGDSIGGWQVVGKGGAPGASVILQLDRNYDEPDNSGNGAILHFYAQNGFQALDLTGEGNQGLTNGVKQTIASIVGHLYSISFYVGNQFDDAPGYAHPSSISFYVNGNLVGTYTNALNTPEQVNWVQFSYDFTALTNLTTFAFLNSTPLGDNYAGLDNVSLRDLTVPEPAGIAPFAAGIVIFAMVRRRDRMIRRRIRNAILSRHGCIPSLCGSERTSGVDDM